MTRQAANRPVLLVVLAMASAGVVAYASASLPASAFIEARWPGIDLALPRAPSVAPSFIGVLREHAVRGPARADTPITEDDGALPSGVTVFDAEYPGVAKLDRDLLNALREAAMDAADDGIELVVNSGWRSPTYQDRLLREAIARYGSEAEAARWVGTATTSAHVSGHAVDIGPLDATVWLSGHGARYGLCQVYRNEPWHYELRVDAIGAGCPRLYADPTHDPRMRP
jgi:D-alanyl-D-alanine carboxypeptidase